MAATRRQLADGSGGGRPNLDFCMGGMGPRISSGRALIESTAAGDIRGMQSDARRQDTGLATTHTPAANKE